MICPNCKNQVYDNIKVCPFCGTNVEQQLNNQTVYNQPNNNIQSYNSVNNDINSNIQSYNNVNNNIEQNNINQQIDQTYESYNTNNQVQENNFASSFNSPEYNNQTENINSELNNNVINHNSNNKKKYILIIIIAIVLLLVIIFFVSKLMKGKTNSGSDDNNQVTDNNTSSNKNGKTYIKVIYLNPEDKTVKCTEEDVKNNLNEFGMPTGIDTGCMKWYVYKKDGNNYKAILDHNTITNVAWQETYSKELIPFNDSNIYPIIEEYKNKWVTDNSYVLDVGIISAQEIADLVGNRKWTNEGGENCVPFYISSDYEIKSIYEIPTKTDYAWLYDYTTACENIGCIEDNNAYRKEKNKIWTKVVYGYWTSTPSEDPWDMVKGSVWVVTDTLKRIGYYTDGYGVRPVITIPKSLVK